MASGPAAGIVDLRAFWNFLRRRFRLIAAVMVLVMAAVVAILLVATPRFSATTVLIVDPRQQRVLANEAVLSGIGADAAAIESQVEVIQSTSLARAVIAQLGLADDPEYTRASLVERTVDAVRDLLGMPAKALSPDEVADRILAKFADNLRVTRRGLTYVLEIGFKADAAAKAARVANAVAEAYLADQKTAKGRATSEAADFLNERLGDLRTRVAAAERAVATYKGENNIIDTGEGRTLADRQIADLNQQLVLARARSAEARARLDQVAKATAASVGAGAIPEALLSPVIANLRGQYAEAARREAETLQTFGPKHPAVATSRAQMADARLQIDREIGRTTSGVRNEFEVAQSRERSLERSVADLKTQSAKTTQAGVKLRELEREAQASRILLEQSLLRFRETSEQEGLQRADARVLSPATPPLKPSEPKTMMVLLAGLVGSVVAGIGSAALAESLSRGFRTTKELETSLAIPVLGHLPLIESSRTPPRPQAPRAGRGFAKRGAPSALVSPGGIARYAVDQPLTPFGEAVRAVRSRLTREAGEDGLVLVIVSAVPDEGKSTVAGNLAHSFARSGVTALLVDADVRNPSVAAPAGSARAPGLARLLRSGPVSSELRDHVDPVSGLHLLPMGEVDDVAAVSELVTGPAMRAFLRHARSRFRVVIVDAPPLLPIVDGRDLLDMADAGLLVIEWNRTDPDSAVAALDAVGPGVRKISGILLNKVDLREQRFYDYGYGYAAAS